MTDIDYDFIVKVLGKCPSLEHTEEISHERKHINTRTKSLLKDKSFAAAINQARIEWLRRYFQCLGLEKIDAKQTAMSNDFVQQMMQGMGQQQQGAEQGQEQNQMAGMMQ